MDQPKKEVEIVLTQEEAKLLEKVKVQNRIREIGVKRHVEREKILTNRTIRAHSFREGFDYCEMVMAMKQQHEAANIDTVEVK